MWLYDIAREQSPDLDTLRKFCRLSVDSGYNALGLYLEHRFAWPATPWAHGKGAVTPEMIQVLQDEFPDLQIIPFPNLLGHCEGFIYTEAGVPYAEERFKGLQADPTNPAFIALAAQILEDTLAIFRSEIVHLGGDETQQLGAGPGSAKVVADAAAQGKDGKAMLYGEHFKRLADRVIEVGRRPAVWGDMFVEHPTALDYLPKETLIFDWQYFSGPSETARRFLDAGFDVVFCPALHTYNAPWLHLPQSERNVTDHAAAAQALNAFGVCVTTWEMGLFGNYETLVPAIRASGEILNTPNLPCRADGIYDELGALAYGPVTEAPVFMKSYLKESERHEEWARLMGVELLDAGGMFSFSRIRSSLKCRLLLYGNPFLLWLRNREDLCGAPGNKALEIAERALHMAPDANGRGVSEFLKCAILFARYAEQAHVAYADNRPGAAMAALAPARVMFDDLAKVAKATYLNIGGSLADIERCRIAKAHVEQVIARIRNYGDGSLGYLPSFEMISHPKFVPHDQAGWWLINQWANE